MSSLPIETVLPTLFSVLREGDNAVLEAPPGAGKTTRVPLALLDQPWLGGQKIIVLEPRRLAARAAAARMAELLGEQIGRRVGFRVRLEAKVSAATRIEVVTEGILTRRLQHDPSLEGVGIVIFDEFHERSLEGDLGLALTLYGRALFRDTVPLKLVVMSATLDGAAVARLLADAPVVRCEGRSYPVDVLYRAPRTATEPLEARVVACVRQALREQSGSILVFLPGQREIRRVHALLASEFAGNEGQAPLLAPLFGDLNLAEQRRAIAPAPAGRTKIVLATAIAETSLTIEGVRVVIDAGLSRLAVFDPRTAMTRLHTERVSRAASAQRTGRAGRLEPGVCYRLWSERQQQQLRPFAPPEIMQADLAPLALALHRFGVEHPAQLQWLDPPPAAAYAQALDLLQALGALKRAGKAGWQLTAHGQRMAELPAHPRLAHLLLTGQARGLQGLACDLAALLSIRDPISDSGADIGLRLRLLGKPRDVPRAARNALRQCAELSNQFRAICGRQKGASADTVSNPGAARWTGFLVACAYPDRIAKARAQGRGRYRLANGRAATLGEDDPLQRESYLAVAQLGGVQGRASDRIYLAAELDEALFDDELSSLVTEHRSVAWDGEQDRLIAESIWRVGEIALRRKEMTAPPSAEKRDALVAYIKKTGLGLLPWNDGIRQWQRRVEFLRERALQAAAATDWPDVSDANLRETLDQWLGPYLDDVTHPKHFAKLDLHRILQNLLPWPLGQTLDQLAPATMRVPTGSRIRIDYAESPPVLAVRLQEMYGCAQTPTIANGVPLKLHLLSPARRPIQVTRDLARFWRGSYVAVRKEMRARYPKHYWPDDPLAAKARK